MSSSSSSTSSPQQSPVYNVPQLYPAPNSKSPLLFCASQLPYEYSSSDCYVQSNPATPSYDYYSINALHDTQYMSSDSPYTPPIRVQQSTPHYYLPDSPFHSPPSMVEGISNSWDRHDQSTHLSPHARQQQSLRRGYQTHRRIPSDSSVASAGPDSPYTQTLAYPQIVDPDSGSVVSAQFDSYDSGYPSTAQYSKSRYAPHTSPNHDSFLAPVFQDYNPATVDAESFQAVQTAMRQALMEQQRVPSLNNQSRSSRESYEGDYNELTRIPSSGQRNITKLNRTMSDIYQDELYNPSLTTSAPPQQSRQLIPQENLLSPQKNSVFTDLFQAAQSGHVTARSASPVTSIARERSPFAPASPYATERFSHSTPNSPARLNSAAQLREQQKAEADARVLAEHRPNPSDFVPPRTISPKEVALDYNEAEEDAKMPLFNQDKRENQGSTFASTTPNLSQSDVDDNTSERSYSNMAPRRQRGSNLAASTASGQSGSTFTFMPPSVPQMPQQYPFISQQLLRRQSSSLRSTTDQSPEFPAQLITMESSKSETTQSEHLTRPDFTSSAESTQRSPSSPGLRRPSDTTAATGSYACTFQDCAARFENAAKLQKHRREAHRSSPPRATAVAPSTSSTTPTSATTPSAGSASASRNQQAGPHKCERINPSTGKPCMTIFSRSYDLTRHEDTIHSSRKTKVRCHLCTEEKTFSRNDALTRHMRVVHPDVDFPGKTKRRG
ncbi:MAG: hypothetical protein L6R40_004857 [Gallowayella cf. fulva]|nr:MAG: hypothetical protein L6R40_004857 [Xanthomendoza cf. fulva]